MGRPPEPRAPGGRARSPGLPGTVPLHDPRGVWACGKRKRPLSYAVWSGQPASTAIVRPPCTGFHLAITKQRHGAACARGDRSTFKAVVYEIRSPDCGTLPGARSDCGVEGLV